MIEKRVAEAVRSKAEASRGTGLPGFCPAVAPEAALHAPQPGAHLLDQAPR